VAVLATPLADPRAEVIYVALMSLSAVWHAERVGSWVDIIDTRVVGLVRKKEQASHALFAYWEICAVSCCSSGTFFTAVDVLITF
jgi:hypothetical protein